MTPAQLKRCERVAEISTAGADVKALLQERKLLCEALLKITEFHNGEHLYLKDCNACHRQEIAYKILQQVGELK